MESDEDDITARDFEGSATKALVRTREESRAVLNLQIDELNSIDDKAMRTVRTSIITLSILVSAGGIAASSSSLSALPDAAIISAAISGIVLLLAVFAGMVTYSASEVEYGISDTHRQELAESNWTSREWEAFLINEYEGWIGEMKSTNRTNERLLSGTMLLLAGGMLAIAISGAFILLSA